MDAVNASTGIQLSGDPFTVDIIAVNDEYPAVIATKMYRDPQRFISSSLRLLLPFRTIGLAEPVVIAVLSVGLRAVVAATY
jgi:hypothetical protein